MCSHWVVFPFFLFFREKKEGRFLFFLFFQKKKRKNQRKETLTGRDLRAGHQAALAPHPFFSVSPLFFLFFQKKSERTKEKKP